MAMSYDASIGQTGQPDNTSMNTPRQRSGWARDVRRRIAHMERCRALPRMQPGEAERLMAAFIAARGVTQCPPAYVVAVQQAVGGA
jgi:hypothetical protein